MPPLPMAHGAARPVGRAPCASKALRKHLTHRLSQNSQRPRRRDECHLPLSPSTAHSISRRGCKSPALYSTKISRWIHQPCKSYCSGMLHQGHSDGKGRMPGPPALEGPRGPGRTFCRPPFKFREPIHMIQQCRITAAPHIQQAESFSDLRVGESMAAGADA